MTDEEKQEEIELKGYFGEQKYVRDITPEDGGDKWKLTSFSLGVSCSTFSDTIREQIRLIPEKRTITVKGIPERRIKHGVEYFNIKITSINDGTVADDDDDDNFL